MIHTMSDIECLALKSTKPAFLALGAVKFDETGIIDRFEVGIDPEDCQRYGLEIEGGTVMYWLHPDRQAARDYILGLGAVDLMAALDGFAMWVEQTPPDDRGSLWGNGAMFDNTRIKSAYDALRLDMPFTYRQHECYRTMTNRFGCRYASDAPAGKVPFEPYKTGIPHTALADAESQALHLIAISQAHGNFL